jgi:hypothetical protein
LWLVRNQVNKHPPTSTTTSNFHPLVGPLFCAVYSASRNGSQVRNMILMFFYRTDRVLFSQSRNSSPPSERRAYAHGQSSTSLHDCTSTSDVAIKRIIKLSSLHCKSQIAAFALASMAIPPHQPPRKAVICLPIPRSLQHLNNAPPLYHFLRKVDNLNTSTICKSPMLPFCNRAD